MRLLIATQHGNIVGGAELYLRSILPPLREAGFEIGLLTEYGRPDTDDGIASRCPPVRWWDVGQLRRAELLESLTAWQPAVVFAQGLADQPLERSLAERLPVVMFPHSYHGACISGNKCHSWPGYEVCHRPLGPACLALYLPRRCGGRNPITMLNLYATQRARLDTFHHYRAVVVSSEHMRAEYLRQGVPADRLQVLPHFAADSFPDSRPPAPRPRTDRLLFVGRITKLKGLEFAFDALPIAAERLGRRLTLVVAGDGPDRAEAEADARRRGLPVEFLGWVDGARREMEMRSADLVVVPSVWPEPFGQVGTQGGDVGLPAVGFAAGGIPDWLLPGVTGESAPGDRPRASELADAIVRALADDAHWQRLRVGAWETANRFTVEAHMEQLIPILHSVAEE